VLENTDNFEALKKTDSPKMGNNLELGKQGEHWAAQFLLDKGYQLLESNYRYGKGEIDLIALQGQILVFVEVKTRSSDLYGPPEGAVTQHKLKQMRKVAGYYLKVSNWQGDIRFDVFQF
jgi:putative endonuclease